MMKYFFGAMAAVALTISAPLRVQAQEPQLVVADVFGSSDALVQAMHDIATAEKLEDFDWVMRRLGFSGYEINDYKKSATTVSRSVDYPREIRPKQISQFDLRRLISSDPKYRTDMYFAIELSYTSPCISFEHVLQVFGDGYQENALPVVIPTPANPDAAPISPELLRWTAYQRVVSYRRQQLRQQPLNTGSAIFRFNKAKCLLEFILVAELASPPASLNK